MTALPDDRLGHLRNLVDLPDLTGTRYAIRHKLAVGGMGSVYLAHDRDLDRNVALKVLTVPDSSGERAARMLREAHIVARLEHPGIVPIHDVGRLADGRIYYTMKYVEGATLESYRTSETPIPDLLRLLQRVCEAIDFAHAQGVIHRDLKPSNIMVGPFGEVLVMDWGIALAASTPTSATLSATRSDSADHQSEQDMPLLLAGEQTAAGAILGTPSYMSPEQARGEAVDYRTDIHGLGAILYFILTGQPPYRDDSLQPKPENPTRQVIRPRDRVKGIPRRLEAICLRAISMSPEDRYQSARAFSEELTAYLDGRPVSAYREMPWERFARWVERNKFIVFIVLAYIIVRFLLILWRGI